MINFKEQANTEGVFSYKLFRNNLNIASGRGTNLVVKSGRSGMLEGFMRAQYRPKSWYIGIYNNTYIPNDLETAVTVSAQAGESTAYTAERGIWYAQPTLGEDSIINLINPAVFELSAPQTIRGAFLVDNPLKGNQSGLLFSIGNFDTPAIGSAGDILLVYYTLTLLPGS